jgi:SMC interacting uncharacterized protein involved in chromosome segregation
MTSDDLTDSLPEGQEAGKVTQPTITAVFRLLQSVNEGQKALIAQLEKVETGLEGLNARMDKVEKGLEGLNARLDKVESRIEGLNTRIDALESRLSRDFASVDTRFVEMADEMKKGFQRLSDKLCDKIDRSRLHAEADYEDLLRRIRQLESRAS